MKTKFIFLLLIISSFLIAKSPETFEDFIVKTENVSNYPFLSSFKNVDFKVQFSEITQPVSKRVIAENTGKTFILPSQINLLIDTLENPEIEITHLQKLYLFSEFIEKNIKIRQVKLEKTRKEIDADIFTQKADFSTKNQDYSIYFKLKDNKIEKAIIYIDGVRKSAFNPVLSLNRPLSYSVSGPDVELEVHGGQNHYYVAVAEDNAATNHTITFELQGLNPNEANVKVQVDPVTGGGLWLDEVMNVDAAGNGTYTWTPPNNTNTGFCDLKFNRNGANINTTGCIIPEKIITDSFDGGYDYTLYYCDQFFQGHTNGVAHAATFVDRCKDALVESWEIQIDDWNIAQGADNDQPEDADDNYHIYVNDNAHDYHGADDNLAFGGNQRAIGIRYNSYMTQNLYSSEQMRINVAMCHEFYHGVQWSLNNSWGSGLWMLEGQARTIPTFQYPNEEYIETTQHFFPRSASNYLNNGLNKRYSNLSYDYCLFWRHLFEKHAGRDTAGGAAIFRETCDGNTDPDIADIETFMDGELNGSLDDEIKILAKKCYFNDPNYGNWDPCPDNAYFPTPSITFSGTLVDSLEDNDEIAAAFGIDYQKYDFSNSVINAKYEFDTDPNGDGAADFYVNLVLLENGTIKSENELGFARAESEFEFRVKDQVDELVVIIVRLDTDETNNSKKEYYSKLKKKEGEASICYILDRSGSMSGTPLSNAKTAAKQGVTTMKIGDEVSIVSFSSSASVNYNRTEIEDENNGDNEREAARNAISGLSSGGMTSIGAGLQTGYNQLVGSEKKVRNYVLLSDGAENTAPMVADVIHLFQNLRDDEIHHIHTIAFGSGADQSQMSWIANETDGVYLYTPDRNNPLELMNIFNTIQNEISDVQTIGNVEYYIDEPDVQEHVFTVDETISEEVITLIWDEEWDQLDLELETPNRTVITSDNWQNFPYVNFVEGPSIQYFTLEGPELGDWLARVTAVNTNYDGSNYGLVFTADSDLLMSVDFDADDYTVNDRIKISAELVYSDAPIIGSTVTAEIEVPSARERAINRELELIKQSEDQLSENRIQIIEDKYAHLDNQRNSINIVLMDDGIHGDGAADDGIYSNYFYDTNDPGTYDFLVEATGDVGLANDFMRRSTRSIYVDNSPYNGTIGGNLTYEGEETENICVNLYTDDEMEGFPLYQRVLSEPSDYIFEYIQDNTYYICAFVDLNNNLLYDQFEPYGEYDLNPLEIVNGTDTLAVDFLLEDIVRDHETNVNSGWNLVAVPVTNPDDPDLTPVELFADDIDPFYSYPYYSSVYSYDSDENNYFVPDYIELGFGYWLRVIQENTTIDAYGYVDESSVTLNLPGEDNAQNGWHLVGNPYDEPLPFSDLELTDIQNNGWLYNTDISNYELIFDDMVLPPWSGMFVKSNSPAGSITFNYPEDRSDSDQIEYENGWLVILESRNNNSVSRFSAGSCEGALDGYDAEDQMSLPALPFIPNFSNMRLAALHENWGGNSGYYMKEMQSPQKRSWYYDLELEFENYAEIAIMDQISVPENYEIHLINNLTEEKVNLETENMVIEAGRETAEKNKSRTTTKESDRFVVSLQLQIAYEPTATDEDSVPDKFAAYGNYPNPLYLTNNLRNSGMKETVISFSIPENGMVKIEIFDIKGRKVNELCNDLKSAGTNEVIWNGKDRSGHYVSTGIYFYRINYNGKSHNRKMLIIK